MIQQLITQDKSLIHAVTPLHETPLLLAASQGHHTIVAFLISESADVNLGIQLPEDHESYTKLHQYTPLD